MPTPSSEHRLLIALAAHLGNPSRVRGYERESASERPLDRRALLALIDDLEAAGLLATELVLRVTPAGRETLGAADRQAAADGLHITSDT